MKEFLATYGKAATASVGALIAGLGTAMIDGDLTKQEGVAAVGAALVFGFAGWAAPYKPAMGAGPDEGDDDSQDDGS